MQEYEHRLYPNTSTMKLTGYALPTKGYSRHADAKTKVQDAERAIILKANPPKPP